MKTPQQFASYMFEKGLGYETETGELVLVHKAVEKMAVYYGIQLKLEVCQNSFEKKSAIVKCTATKDNHVYESLGEVHPETNSFSYIKMFRNTWRFLFTRRKPLVYKK